MRIQLPQLARDADRLVRLEASHSCREKHDTREAEGLFTYTGSGDGLTPASPYVRRETLSPNPDWGTLYYRNSSLF